MRVAIVPNFPHDDHRLVCSRGTSKELGRRGHFASTVLQGEREAKREAPSINYQICQLGADTHSTVEQIRSRKEIDVGLSYDEQGWPPSEVAVHTRIFENMVAGIPIIAPRHPANAVLLTDSFNAILTDPSPRVFGAGIMRLIRDSSLTVALAHSAKATAKAHDFSKKARLAEEVYLRGP